MGLLFSRNKIPCASQNARPKSCLPMFASLVTLDGFHLLLSTQMTADLTPERSDGTMSHPLSHIYAKTPFCCVEIVANFALNRQSIVVCDRLWAIPAPTLNTVLIDKCWCKMVNTLPSDIFKSFAMSRNLNLRSAKTSLWVFFGVF